jgi:hypothetical protein
MLRSWICSPRRAAPRRRGTTAMTPAGCRLHPPLPPPLRLRYCGEEGRRAPTKEQAAHGSSPTLSSSSRSGHGEGWEVPHWPDLGTSGPLPPECEREQWRKPSCHRGRGHRSTEGGGQLVGLCRARGTLAHGKRSCVSCAVPHGTWQSPFSLFSLQPLNFKFSRSDYSKFEFNYQIKSYAELSDMNIILRHSILFFHVVIAQN